MTPLTVGNFAAGYMGHARGSRAKNSLNVSGMLWASWNCGRAEEADLVLDQWQAQGVDMDAGTINVMLMTAEWALEERRRMSLERCLGLPAMQLPLALASLAREDPAHETREGQGGYAKLARLLEAVEAAPSGVVGVLQAIECFAVRSSWLKIAGDSKANLLKAGLEQAELSLSRWSLELGTFVGYTTVQLASSGRHWGPRGGVVSLELDAAHVLLARHFVARALESARAEVWVGLTYDTLARLPEAFGFGGTGFVFMDHRGTRFHCDMARLEALGQSTCGATFVADNVLKPGAPLWLWHMPRSGQYLATAWSLMEFLHVDAEDWMFVGEPQISSH